MELSRKTIDVGIEKRIITGMIVSKKYLRYVFPVFKPDYLDNIPCREISKWCYAFFNKYEEVPYNHIQDLFQKYTYRLSEEDSLLVETLLKEISDSYEQQGHRFNTDYMIDESMKYFQKKEMEITTHNVSILLEEDKIEEAEEEMRKLQRVVMDTSGWTNPFDPNMIKLVFEQKDEGFLKFPKALGRYMGEMERGWLVAISGQFKGGKTWFLQEFAVIALLSRLNVAFFSLEMTEIQMLTRLFKRLAPGASGGEFFPVFDCKKNQDGSCNKSIRVNKYRLLDKDGNKPKYNPKIAYKICTECRGSSDFEMDTWFKPVGLLEFDSRYVNKRMKTIEKTFGDRIQLKSFPRFSANLSDIERSLEILKNSNNFIPDVIIIDYADILKPETKDSGVQKEDLTWMALARLAGVQKALVVTATQVTKDALGAKDIKVKHTARWVGKLGHVDAMYTLNQVDEEKLNGVMRIGTMVHRHYEFSETRQCTILQNLNVGQALLDSEM
jgi:hypothetical protein